MKANRKISPQMWLPGTMKCLWQEAAGRKWHAAVALRELDGGFFEVEVDGMGRRIGTFDRDVDYPGYLKPLPRRRSSSKKS